MGARSVTVNSVLPGLTRTDVLAGVVAFLASDAARWITGQTINAAGGMV